MAMEAARVAALITLRVERLLATSGESSSAAPFEAAGVATSAADLSDKSWAVSSGEFFLARAVAARFDSLAASGDGAWAERATSLARVMSA